MTSDRFASPETGHAGAPEDGSADFSRRHVLRSLCACCVGLAITPADL
jgi:hypothetical protein